MNDESFKSEAKKILKEEDPNITDEGIKDILKSAEKVLSGESKVENDEDLDEVVGGLGATGRSIARKTIKTICTVGGFGVGGRVVGGAVDNATGFSKARYDVTKGKNLSDLSATEQEEYNKFVDGHLKEAGAVGVSALAGGGAGAYGGYKFANYICDKLGLND